MDDNLKLLLDISDCREVNLLPKELRDKIMAVSDAERKREDEQRKVALAEARAVKEKTDELMNRLLCVGQWGEKIPPNRRFALCHRIGRRLVHWYNKKPEYKEESFYCAIDLVRGIMPVEWHYYNVGTEEEEIDFLYNRRLRPLFEAFDSGNERNVINRLRFDWDGQSVSENVKFQVLDYHVEKGNGLDWIFPIQTGNKSDRVVVDGKSDYRTLAEHQEVLKAKFS